MKEGWVCQGGLSTCANDNSILVGQAMVKGFD